MTARDESIFSQSRKAGSAANRWPPRSAGDGCTRAADRSGQKRNGKKQQKSVHTHGHLVRYGSACFTAIAPIAAIGR